MRDAAAAAYRPAVAGRCNCRECPAAPSRGEEQTGDEVDCRLTRRTAIKGAGALRTRPAREGAVSCPPEVQRCRPLGRRPPETPKAPQRRVLERLRDGVQHRQEAVEAASREAPHLAIVSLEPSRVSAPASSSSPRPGPEVRPGRAEKRRRIEPCGPGNLFVQQVEPSPAALRMMQLRARVQAREAAAAARSSTEDAG